MLETFFEYTWYLAEFQEKVLMEISGKIEYSSGYNKEKFETFPQNFPLRFFLNIGDFSGKVSTIKVPNIEVCDFILVQPRVGGK